MAIKVLFCASEIRPFAETGGLADVAASLPKALGKLGVEVVAVMPRYAGIHESKSALSENVPVYFIENDEYFNRHGLYGDERGDYPDNLQRFAFFCEKAFSLAKELGFKPDIVHAHDWHTALMPVMLKTSLKDDPFFKGTKSLLTIHNLVYQGVFADSLYPLLKLGDEQSLREDFEFYGRINLLKAGILHADALTAVSPTYAREIQTREAGAGLEAVVQKRASRLKGILNGIDTDFWNPGNDPWIEKRFGGESLSGRDACKLALQKASGLREDLKIPVYAMVTRLVEQKGLDLFIGIAKKFLKKKAQFLLLGQGDEKYHEAFKNIHKEFPNNTFVHIGFEKKIAHTFYAGSDFFIMPSHFEPCGLGQLVALRYGALPIVRDTGGLSDTITDVDQNSVNGNGFVFKNFKSGDLFKALERSLQAFDDPERFLALRRRAMEYDFSWEKSAEKYKHYYEEIMTL